MLLDEVMTAAEAAEIWGKSPGTGYKGNAPRFLPTEARKAGRIWLVTREGMNRLYGEPKK